MNNKILSKDIYFDFKTNSKIKKIIKEIYFNLEKISDEEKFNKSYENFKHFSKENSVKMPANVGGIFKRDILLNKKPFSNKDFSAKFNVANDYSIKPNLEVLNINE